MRETTALAWSVDGTYFEACSCLPICPCRQVGGRDGSRSSFVVCDFALSWWIKHGHSGELDLTDRAGAASSSISSATVHGDPGSSSL